MQNKIVNAFGTSVYTPFELSKGLTDLRVSHYLIGKVGNKRRRRFYDRKLEQPAIPIICCSLSELNYLQSNYIKTSLNLIVFLCEAKEILDDINIKQMGEKNLDLDLRSALTKKFMINSWVPHYNAKSTQDYINLASKPSFLNELQTLIYKINPYALRKEIQRAALLYLASKLPMTKVKAIVKQSVKSEQLLPMLQTSEATNLRTAISKIQNGEQMETVLKVHNLDSFDITYILKSITD